MTKRFTIEQTTIKDCIVDNATGEQLDTFDYTERLCEVLNTLAEENEQLKQAYTQLKHRHSLLHDVCIDAECDRDGYRKDVVSLEKENERLKKERNHFEKKKTEYLTEWNTCRIQNTELKNLIQEAYTNERTQIGKNTLKQLLEQI